MDEHRAVYGPSGIGALGGHLTHGYGMGQSGVGQDGLQDMDPGCQRKHDIGDILQEIMTITDQSLDEAQARLALSL